MLLAVQIVWVHLSALMDVLSAHSYDTFVELEREEYQEKKLKRW